MLLVKTAKYIKPFSKYVNEEEYLVGFNTAFKVISASNIYNKHKPPFASCLTRSLHQVKAVCSHDDSEFFKYMLEEGNDHKVTPNHDLIVLEEI